MIVVTRFAPSPTGYLHIGSARTALFNYLYAKHHGGKFLLRIEDTDQARSTQKATSDLLSGLKWLGIDWDEEIVYQAKRNARHAEIAYQILDQGKAYRCYCSQAEIDQQRHQAVQQGESFLFNSPWRDKVSHIADKKFVIRLKAPKTGSTTINDQVQGKVTVENRILDDMVLLRSDGSATYMLAVVVDDHDMGITHIIRGDDHLNNAFRQAQLYEACGWKVPTMAHIPLIHGQDGMKLSKRHGAIGVEAYRDMGYLPEALINYLLRLGWSHGDHDTISREEAIKWFDVMNVGKSPSRLDFAKMNSVNSHYIRESNNKRLVELTCEVLIEKSIRIDQEYKILLEKVMSDLKVRAELIKDLAELALIYHPDNLYQLTDDAEQTLSGNESIINESINMLNDLADFSSGNIQLKFRELAAQLDIKIGALMQPIRALLTGKTASPSVFDIIALIGKEKTLQRLNQNFKSLELK